jgi:Zn finger protein HypA/HybF involved in hydrogenase expression
MIAKDVYLKCDECLETDTFTAGRNAKEAREEGKRQGWQINKSTHRDYCPKCRKNKQTLPSQVSEEEQG